MKQRLKQVFCKHNYRIPKEYDDQEERDRLVCFTTYWYMVS